MELSAVQRLLVPILTVLYIAAGAPLHAQSAQRTVPNATYYMRFGNFYDGDYQEAARSFQAEARGSIRNAQSRWIDSICYETMWGECCYEMGNLQEALEHYTAALTLFRNFSDWMLRVQFEPAVRAAQPNARVVVPWGTSSRPSQLGQYASSEKLFQGQIDQSNVVQQGGVVQVANFFPVTPQEIVRCTALAMRRRATLLGPVAKTDTLTNELVSATGRPVATANHWSTCWGLLERGFALATVGQDTQAIECLQRSVQAAGQFDHPLTSVALLGLGQCALRYGDFPKAAWYFTEASYAAVNYPDYGVLEESLRYGMLAHLMANQKGIFPPLEIAMQWAKVKNLRQLRVSLLLCTAENCAILGETRQAATLLDEARATIGRRDMGLGRLGGRLHYLSALTFYQEKKTGEGDAELTAAMDYMRKGSLWLFHIGLVDAMYSGGAATERAAAGLFGDVLRDPQPADWTTDPQEALAVLTTPHPLPYEHWFEAAFQRKDYVNAIEISERAKRHRFFTSLRLGGRTESLRWLLESPVERLSQQAQTQRQDILTRYPAYEQLSRQAGAVRAKLNTLPLVAEDQAVMRDQSKKLDELAAMSSQQEAILHEIAVRREPAAMLFPPLRPTAEIQKTLPPKHAALVFFATGRGWYGFLLTHDRIGAWNGSPTGGVSKQLVTLLHDLGQYQQNHEIAVKDLGEEKWKQPAKQLLDVLLKNSPADFSQPFNELVIVPDGLLWYMPFESLQVMVNGKPQSLLSRFKIRYVPTLSLATQPKASRNFAGSTAVVLGKLHPHDTDEVVQAAFQQLIKSLPDAVALRSPPPAPSAIYRVLFPRLIVLDDLAVSDQSPYGWSPTPIDRGKTSNTLADWMQLPWGGPDVIILPGYHTAAEDAFKRSGNNMPGNEVFLSVCGLMANGARTMLLSRWRMGGQTGYDLIREFAQELPHVAPAEAWQRAVTVMSDTRLNLEAEPRVKRAPNDEAPKAEHPFFWAGYMLIDCGTRPEGTDAESDDAVVEPDAADASKKPPEPGKEQDAAQPAAKPAAEGAEAKETPEAADKPAPKKGAKTPRKPATKKSTEKKPPAAEPPADTPAAF